MKSLGPRLRGDDELLSLSYVKLSKEREQWGFDCRLAAED